MSMHSPTMRAASCKRTGTCNNPYQPTYPCLPGLKALPAGPRAVTW